MNEQEEASFLTALGHLDQGAGQRESLAKSRLVA